MNTTIRFIQLAVLAAIPALSAGCATMTVANAGKVKESSRGPVSVMQAPDGALAIEIETTYRVGARNKFVEHGRRFMVGSPEAVQSSISAAIKKQQRDAERMKQYAMKRYPEREDILTLSHFPIHATNEVNWVLLPAEFRASGTPQMLPANFHTNGVVSVKGGEISYIYNGKPYSLRFNLSNEWDLSRSLSRTEREAWAYPAQAAIVPAVAVDVATFPIQLSYGTYKLCELLNNIH